MANQTPFHVLHVDNDPERLTTTARHLETEYDNLDVTAEGTVDGALEEFQNTDFDCIVSDFNLEGVDTFEFFEEVKERESEIPFIMFANEGSEVVEEAFSRGVTEFVPWTTVGQVILAEKVHESASEYRRQKESLFDLPDDVSEAHMLDQLVRQLPTSIYAKDAEARHLLLSDYELSPEEAIGKTDLEVYGEELARKSYEDDIHAIENEEPLHNKEEFNPDNGEWTITSKIPWYDEDGNVRGLIGATRFITEKKKYEQKIERENERLDRFVSIVSHDLRNPLSVASGYLESVKEDVDHEHLDEVEESLERMESLIEHLLELARKGQDIEETETVNLSDVFEESWKNVSTNDAKYVATGEVQFEADRNRTIQMFSNLIRNSLEHVGEDVNIEVGATKTGFYYEDDGPGIPDSDKNDIFDPGFTTDTEGTGFGLSIVKEIVEAHDWGITVTDGKETGGARFEISLNPEFKAASSSENVSVVHAEGR